MVVLAIAPVGRQAHRGPLAGPIAPARGPRWGSDLGVQAGAGASWARPPPGSPPPGSPPAGSSWCQDRLALRSAGLIAPSTSAPATHARPPLTTENVTDSSWATSPASALPIDGAVVTCARYRLETRPRSASGV